MSFFIFKYCLPALLGYTLFVGIAGRFNPLRKPSYREERPSWLLGVWTGLSVSLVLTVGLHLAYATSPQGAKLLLTPSSWFLAALLAPGFIAYLMYRKTVRNSVNSDNPVRFDWASYADDQNFTELTISDTDARDPLDPEIDPQDLDSMHIPEPEAPLLATFLDRADLDTVDTQNLPNAINDPDQSTTDALADLLADTHKSTTASLSSESAEDEAESEQITPDTHEGVEIQHGTASLAAAVCGEVSEAVSDQLDQTMFEPLDPADVLSDKDVANSADATSQSESADTFDQKSLSSRFQSLYSQLEKETALREETEKHLRITRKALSVLEAESRTYESTKADAIIALEEKLTDSINLQTEFESLAAQEKDRRMVAETNAANLKQDLVKAKHGIRRSTAARAKALSTANKSIAFARQTLQVRARLESELQDAKETLKNRQATISSLIRALEKEKRRTQEDVSSMARQLVLHEKQLQARRSLEDVARSVENKLTSRLVKKVAKARPLASDSK